MTDAHNLTPQQALEREDLDEAQGFIGLAVMIVFPIIAILVLIFGGLMDWSFQGTAFVLLAVFYVSGFVFSERRDKLRWLSGPRWIVTSPFFAADILKPLANRWTPLRTRLADVADWVDRRAPKAVAVLLFSLFVGWVALWVAMLTAIAAGIERVAQS